MCLLSILFIGTGFSQLIWQRVYGGPGWEEGRCVDQTTDGGYIVVGFTDSFGNGFQIYIVKTDSLGDTLWTKNYGGTGTERGYSVQQTTDDGYIIVGYTASFGNNEQVYLIKTDSLGDTLWTKNYGGTGAEQGHFVQQTADGGYIIIGGSFYHRHRQWPIILIKTDSLGDTLWTREYGVVPGQGYEDAYSVYQTTDGGYIVAGYTDTVGLGHVYLIKTDSLGDPLWERYYGGDSLDRGYSVQQTTDGGYIIAGLTYSFGNFGQVYLIKTDADGNGGIVENTHSLHPPHIPYPLVCPNPFVSFTKVIGYEKERFLLYDVLGRQVGSYYGDKIGFGLPVGVYFLIPEDQSLKPVRLVKVK
jgi:hypothetical protein